MFLLHKSSFLTFFFSVLLLSVATETTAQDHYCLVFWNVENLYDIWDDPATDDDAFTPDGDNHWSRSRYDRKLRAIYKTIAALGNVGDSFSMPAVIGLAEVENDKALRDLCKGTPLRKYDYDFIHYDSPDRRGIDNALLYRPSLFRPYFSRPVNVSDSSADFFTRDILHVEGGTASGDTLVLLVCHLPSKRGGNTADERRVTVAGFLGALMDSLRIAHPSAAIVVMGDFNSGPGEHVMKNVLMNGRESNFVNLMERLPSGAGTYKFRDNWEYLDQMVVSRNLCAPYSGPLMASDASVFRAPFLLLNDLKNMGKKVNRTFLGPRYMGGYSDHLPVYMQLIRLKESD